MDYKQEIRDSRRGCLGGSDARLLQQISECGYIPDSAKKRLAVCKGLIENDDSFQTNAMRAGDVIENAIYEHLTQLDESYQSNPLWVSEKYSKPNCRLICHPDIVKVDKEKKLVKVYECKCTKYPIEDTLHTYRPQLYIEYLLGQEYAKTLGRGYNVAVYLVHYNTQGLDLSEGIEFDVDRLTTKSVKFRGGLFSVEKAMEIIDDYLNNLDYYVEGDVVEAEYLPTEIYDKFANVATILREIKEREKQVETFKQRLYDFLSERGITKVKCDDFSFSLVKPTTSKSFDAKTFLADYTQVHPVLAKRVKEKYTKTSQKKGYVKITVSDKE